MADINRSERLQPSLLDRLTDLAPEQLRESLDQQTLTMGQLRRAVLRDLGWLLNSTNLESVADIPEEWLAARSTLNYGISSVAGTSTTSDSAQQVEQVVARAIKAFEPRIRPDTLQVRVRPLRDDEGLPTLVLEISGELWAQPVPQQLFVETTIDLQTRLTVVSETKSRAA